MAGPYPNDQGNPAGAMPVRLVTSNGGAFYNASGSGGGSAPYQGTPLGYQQLTGISAATSLTVPATATYAVVVAETSDSRWRDDGTAPTASVGMPIFAGEQVTFSGDLSALQFIQINAGAIINVSYYK